MALPLAFLAVALLGAGYWAKGRERHLLRMGGWVAFALYWPTQAPTYFAENSPFNAWFAVLSPLLFGFLAYHEWRSRAWGEDPPALRWLAGTLAISAGTYFLVYEVGPITNALIWFTTLQSVLLLRHGFGVDADFHPSAFEPNNWDVTLGSAGEYAVTVVLACTAVQAIMIFVGAISTAPGVERRRRWTAYALIAPVIWGANLLRIAGITVWYKVWDLPPWFAEAWGFVGVDVGTLGSHERFEFFHVIVGQVGSLLVLILLALWLFRRVPEVHGMVLDVFDLPRRRRPRHYEREGGVQPDGVLP